MRGSATALFTLCIIFLLAGWNQSVRAQSPQDIVLMLDNSGSMRKNDPDFLTRVAVSTFLENLHGDVQIAIIMFDQNVHVLVPLTQLNDATRQDFLNSLKALDYRGLLTNSPAALEKSTYELRTKGRPNAQKSIIFMTDGIVDVGKDGFDQGDVEKARWMKTTLVDEAVKYQVRIYGIAYTDNADFELIQTLSSKTGGEYYRAANAQEIESVFNNILGELFQRGTLVTAPAPESTTPLESGNIQPLQETTPAPSTEVAAQTENSLPDTSLPEATSAEVAQTESSLPEPTLPEPTLPEPTLPEPTLPEPALPESALPETALPQDTNTQEGLTDSQTPIAATTATTDNSSDTAPTATTSPASDPDATPTSTPTQPQGSTESTANSPIINPAPATPAQNLPVAMLAGVSGLLLALIAMVLFIIKRKPATTSSVDLLMPKAYLNDVGNITGQNSYELGEKPTIIGRLQGSDPLAANYVVIDESTIGRRHSLIEYREHSFWVADQNSLNGTFVNNKRIETSTRLKHGDRLRFHKHEFEFVVLDMMETDRTMMSQTEFAERTGDLDDDDDDEDATLIRADESAEAHEPSGEDETIRRPGS